MIRYKSKSSAQIGDRVVFDNTGSFYKDIPKIRYVGEVIDMAEGNKIKISVMIPGKVEKEEIEVPYFVVQ